jgi:hypothetical protein
MLSLFYLPAKVNDFTVVLFVSSFVHLVSVNRLSGGCYNGRRNSCKKLNISDVRIKKL